MNRATRRKVDKQMHHKFTDAQYQDFKNNAIKQYIEDKVKESRERTTEVITESLIEVLSKKEYRISDDRKSRILNDFMTTLDSKVKKGEGSSEKLSKCK